ncbi:MAG TPA: chromosome segregation protein SMC [Stellaceae bacterium]|jgi:chromosome segregation protein|nr:chromosome segregation protein SMC [Stellaceae bacterium]
MQVERLRLTGFKSFVEPTELAIEPGLTGIVGPNGCGKSNLVEALRWVMGEASAKRLRGGEMDDVIFGGSAGRPARNLAEVMLTLDNSARDAPFAYNESTTVEVARRIARGGGSSYRINGREVRARDVQLLFADAATGPHSGALVSQGRIGALVGAKPEERRLLLDEAAGTAGLHARRHEAELKLRAAENNLARLDDVIATLSAQIDGLKRQARQAQRYRRLGEQIRLTEAQLFDRRWRTAIAEAERIAGELRAAERTVAASTEEAVAAERNRAEAEAVLPALRMAQAAAAAAAQRIAHAREALEQELGRIVAARAEAEQRLTQVQADREREAEHLADAEAALARLAEERQGLQSAAEAAARQQADAEGRHHAASGELAGAETGLQQMTEACATGEARRAALERQTRDLAERQGRLQARLADSEQQRAALAATLVPPEALAQAAAAVAEAATQLETGRSAAAACGERLAACQDRETQAVDTAREAERALAHLKAEADALEKIVAPAEAETGDGASMLSLLQVTEGFEAATAALFDGELTAPQLPPDTQAASELSAGWLELAPLSPAPLPDGAHPLAGAVGAPPALARRLTRAAWVESEAAGWRLQPALEPGQSVVDRDGRLWRWDGFVRLKPDSTATAERLRQRNRLNVLAGEIELAAVIAGHAAEAAATARAARDEALSAERSAVAQLRAAEARLAQARDAEAELTRRALAAESRLAALNETIDKIAAESRELGGQTAEAERALAILPDPALARTGLESAREQAIAARRHESETRAVLDRLARDADARKQRLAGLATEEESWRRRRDGAAAQHAVLGERQAALGAELAALAERPAAIATESEALARSAVEKAAEQRSAEDALAVGETRLREAAERARAAERALAEAREGRARLEAQRDGAAEAVSRLRAEILERLGVPPEELATTLSDQPGAASADSSEVAVRLDRLLRERDAIGPVNLIAEQEMAEAETRHSGLARERADLTEAIARLRRGIGTLDQEGRNRLVAAFEHLNEHFGELFVRLFGGGKAELAWAGDGDPLECGLEIMASPPGKRLQSLSLLSGGEQALTAIALIFAVFLTNPAPLCVLDEVDAPLDDANVDRFCRLVADIADTTDTRFLLITHHRVTMARMDRLFGVTMAERGVSQLVSVDLVRAAELRQTA